MGRYILNRILNQQEVKIMSTQNRTLAPAAAEVINQVSGAYSTPFWDGVYSVTESLQTLREINGTMDALHECGKDAEAYHLILALYDLAAIEVPASIMELEPYPDAVERFIGEFLMDVEDLMYDYESEAQGV